PKGIKSHFQRTSTCEIFEFSCVTSVIQLAINFLLSIVSKPPKSRKMIRVSAIAFSIFLISLITYFFMAVI
ncbi:MAG: hypothetical protein AAF696_35605, partial [Bacteroidota bacterium]